MRIFQISSLPWAGGRNLTARHTKNRNLEILMFTNSNSNLIIFLNSSPKLALHQEHHARRHITAYAVLYPSFYSVEIF